MSRRRKPKAERKDLVLRVRLTLTQRDSLAEAAARRGLPVSTWLLMTGLDAAANQKGSADVNPG